MNDTPTQVALRQMRAQFSSPVTLLILCAVAVLLAILGPFGSDTRLTLGPRLAYWLVTATVTYGVGLFLNTWLMAALPERLSVLMRGALIGLATGLGVVPTVVALNYATLGYRPTPSEWLPLLAQVWTVSVIISVIFQAIALSLAAPGPDSGPDARPDASPDARSEPTPPALLDRLPLDKRGALVSLSSEDHYTRVRTTRGEALVLIRLSDAIKDAAPVSGLQVHRSHWVALAQVTSARRDGDRAVLSMSHGDAIPVSRSNIAAIKDAGLLPQ